MEENIIYLDNSTTSIIPNEVLEKIKSNLDENLGSYARGNNSLNITKQVENTRKLIAEFIGAKSEETIVFTAGATYSSNTIAYSYCLNNLEDNDEILLCDNDHKSTTLPFYNIQNIFENFGKNIKITTFPIDTEGDYNEEIIFDKINEHTKILVLTHIHNLYGLEMNIEYIVENVRKINKDIKIILDASQSIGHIKIDVEKLDIDMLYFSGHKMMAMQGVGVLYIKNDIEKFSPFIIGGGLGGKIQKNISKSQDLENGSINTQAILSLKEAVLHINKIGIEEIENKIYTLTRYLYDNLNSIDMVEFNKGIATCKCALGYGIISFKINGQSSSEIGDILKDYNIIVRTGDFCSTSKQDDLIRISLYYYNTKEEIDKLIKVLKYIIDDN